jgi:hypothetical protein
MLLPSARLAFNALTSIRGPDIPLAPTVLPWYAFLSASRMAAACWGSCAEWFEFDDDTDELYLTDVAPVAP